MEITLIDWIDAEKMEEYHPANPHNDISIEPSHSVGFVAKETEDEIMISQTCHGNGWYRDNVIIPKSAIINRKIIKGGVDEKSH